MMFLLDTKQAFDKSLNDSKDSITHGKIAHCTVTCDY